MDHSPLDRVFEGGFTPNSIFSWAAVVPSGRVDARNQALSLHHQGTVRAYDGSHRARCFQRIACTCALYLTVRRPPSRDRATQKAQRLERLVHRALRCSSQCPGKRQLGPRGLLPSPPSSFSGTSRNSTFTDCQQTSGVQRRPVANAGSRVLSFRPDHLGQGGARLVGGSVWPGVLRDT